MVMVMVMVRVSFRVCGQKPFRIKAHPEKTPFGQKPSRTKHNRSAVILWLRQKILRYHVIGRNSRKFAIFRGDGKFIFQQCQYTIR